MSAGGIKQLGAFVACAAVASVCIVDALHFHRQTHSQYLTPWFPPQWWQAPYTHLALSLHESRTYWTKNAVGTERWLVREVAVGRVVFWTALERVPLQADAGG